jgi:DNA-binding transcriptional ArsR family regulator
MLTIELDAQDLGRIRLAVAPAPVLEIVLMLFELRQHRPSGGHGRPAGGHDWRMPARSAFASAGRPLLQLVPSCQRAYYLDVLTPDAEEAFHLVQATPEPVHRDNVDRIARMNVAPVPGWLRRYADGDPVLLRELDRALRAVHSTCLAPWWPSVQVRFHRDVAERTALLQRHGVIAMLSTLSPDLRMCGMTLEGRYPWDRRVRLMGRGLTLMPSAFWTGHPLITWDPQDKSRYVLIYPARFAPGQVSDHGTSLQQAADPLAMLLGVTRAATLRALLRQSHNTTTLARHVGVSQASASQHAATLRAAGLITSERHGRAVIHRISELGLALLWCDRPSP